MRRRTGGGLTVALALALALASPGCGRIVLLHDPLSADEHVDLGAAYEARGQLDLARKEYRRALRMNPAHHHARFNLGNVEAARGKWNEAEKCWRRTLRDSTDDADAMNNLAIALLRQGRKLDEAHALASRAAASGGPRDSLYRATLAEVEAARR
jgi:Flp pilus assembly protein TadD